MTLFFALCFIGVAIAGFSAFMIFWPLTLIHVRDRHPVLADEFGEGAFLKPGSLRWLVTGGFKAAADRSLTGLAAPARIALLVMLGGLGMALLLWILSQAIK
ncbi:MAG: hypothetical protein WA956_04305 [Stenotrophomonas sp.]